MLDKLIALPGAWDVGTFLQNSTNTIKTWGGYFIILIGVVLIIVSVAKIAKGFISHGKTQVNWGMCIVMLIIGGALSFGGYTLVENIASGGQKTIEDLGGGSILPVVIERSIN